MFGRIGPEELILILIVLLVIFGPSRLPGLGGALGKSMRSFKRAVHGEDNGAADASAVLAPDNGVSETSSPERPG